MRALKHGKTDLDEFINKWRDVVEEKKVRACRMR